MRRALHAVLLLTLVLSLLCLSSLWQPPQQRGTQASRAAPPPVAAKSVSLSAASCAAVFDGAGRALPLSACARCTAPWLTATDAALGRLCRCMGACSAEPGADTDSSAPAPAASWTEAHDAEARAARGVQLVIGLGTGRCGTVTLSQVLRSQQGCARTFTHEQHPVLPWSPASDAEAARLATARVRALLQRRLQFAAPGAAPESQPAVPLVGDVASFYLPYVRLFLALEPGAKFVVLQRPREEVVSSFLTKDRGIDLWSACADRSTWSRDQAYWATAHPKLPCAEGQAPDAERSLRAYWEVYNATVAALSAAFPDRVRTWPVPRVFRDAQMQTEMLRWAGVGAPRVVAPRKHNCIANCTERHRRALAAIAV